MVDSALQGMLARVTAGRLGRVEEHDQGLRWRVVFPGLRWFRFVYDRFVHTLDNPAYQRETMH